MNSHPGETVGLTAVRDCILIIHAAGNPMEVEGDLPPTDLVALLRRANPVIQETPPLPEPLAEPKFDLHIDSGDGAGL